MKSTIAAPARTGILTILFIAAFACESAGQVKERTPEELAARADVIAVGKVSALVSQWNSDHSRIFTTVTLAVDQYLKGGNVPGPLNILVAGGEVDGVGEMYSHTATFRRDESILVFAEKDRQGNYRVSGGTQGKYTVTRDGTTGNLIVGETRTLQEMAALVKKAVQDQHQK